MMFKETMGTLAMVLTFIAYWPYIRQMHRKVVKPHVFSWVVWAIATLVVFSAQLEDNAGWGAWPIGLSGVITGYIAYLAYRLSPRTIITRADWFFLTASLSSLPLWYFSSNPFWAVVILTMVDLFGFGPTFRKAYHKPYEENINYFAIFTVRNVLVILALENLSPTTVLFPAAVGVGCLMLIVLLVVRRRVVPQTFP